MKLNELIEKLERFHRINGNIEVCTKTKDIAGNDVFSVIHSVTIELDKNKKVLIEAF